MKVRAMPIDQYKLSIEARPLQVLFSKYNPTEANGPLQVVRPLGKVRKERRLSSERSKVNQNLPKVSSVESVASPVSTAEAGERLCLSEMNLPKGQDSPTSKCERGSVETCPDDCCDGRHRDEQYHTGSRSRKQAFEQQYKIAAARSSGLYDHLARKTYSSSSKRDYNKKVIHLPLFKINLKTFNGDVEDSKALESTRESLRQMMELHKAKMKPANVITANIRNYEFNAPSTGSQTSRTAEPKYSNGLLISAPFPSKTFLRSPRYQSDHRTVLVNQHHANLRVQRNKPEHSSNAETKSSVSDQVDCTRSGSSSETAEMGPEDEADDSLLSLALRPDTALTLGSTIHQIDRVIKSPGSDELRELSEALRTTDTQPSWPSYEDIQRLHAQSLPKRNKSESRDSIYRSGTEMGESDTRQYLNFAGSPYPFNESDHLASRGGLGNHFSHAGNGIRKPTLRYTSKQTTYKLDPIIVPSHTCTECRMCNLYQRESEESPCPPNSPIPSPAAQDAPPDSNPGRKVFFNEDTLVTRPSSSRGSKRTIKPEVLHVSRIMLSGDLTPSLPEDHTVLSYMKANG